MRKAYASLGHDCRVVVWGPRLLEGGDGNLLVAAGVDGAVVEMDHTGSAVDAGHHHEVISRITLPGPVPDSFGVKYDNDPATFP